MARKTQASLDIQTPLHPNAQKLLDITIDLLTHNSIEQIHLAQVLQLSGISNGSLYHHFEDFQDLLELAIEHRFTAGLNESLRAIATLLESKDAQDFRNRVEHIVLTFHSQDRRPFRMARLETFGALTSRPRLAARIGRAQYESNLKQAEFFAEFQNRGWFRNDLDPLAISTFMTATFLGRVVDDIADIQVDPDQWSRVAMTAFRSIMFEP